MGPWVYRSGNPKAKRCGEEESRKQMQSSCKIISAPKIDQFHQGNTTFAFTSLKRTETRLGQVSMGRREIWDPWETESFRWEETPQGKLL